MSQAAFSPLHLAEPRLAVVGEVGSNMIGGGLAAQAIRPVGVSTGTGKQLVLVISDIDTPLYDQFMAKASLFDFFL